MENIDWSSVNNDIKELSLENEIKIGKVVSVYDGDTIKVVFPLNNKLYKWNCRLGRIDTPELRTKNKLEKQYGYIVRDKLRQQILNKVVKIKCGKFDKYGRLLTEIYSINLTNDSDYNNLDLNEENNINQWLIDNNYAFEYDGGTKKKWEPYLENNNLI